jgi:glycosyltransferase involved in cell wall biosynthesis
MFRIAKGLMRSLISQLAPIGSRQRRVLRKIKYLPTQLHALRVRLWSLQKNGPSVALENPYDLDSINCILRFVGMEEIHPTSKFPEGNESPVARWVIGQYLSNPTLRKRVRFTDSVELIEAFDHQVHDPIQAVIRSSFGKVVRQAYDEYPLWRELFPLALTPAGLGQFLTFLFTTTEQTGFSPEAILWFHLENAEDPYRGMVASYLRQPDWQKRFPDALHNLDEWESFLNWVRETYSICGDWIDQLPAPTGDNQAYDPSQDTRKEGINLLGHFCYQCGLQEATSTTRRALQIGKIPHSMRDVPAGIFSIDSNRPDREAYLGLEYFDTTLIQLAPAPVSEIAHSISGLNPRKGTYRIALWYWELEQFPKAYRRIAKQFDEIWAPTRFIQEAISSVVSVPVIHMPPAVRIPFGNSFDYSQFGINPEKFTFLFMFDMCSSFERKNPLGLIEAYRQAFHQDERVQLVIKVSRGEYDPENFAKLQKSCSKVGINLIDRVMTRNEADRLMHLCNAYISLHRSEGFGLPLAEAMLLGKPVIATGYSGNLDFMTAQNSILIPYELKTIQETHPLYARGARWAEPCTDSAAKAMRKVFENRCFREQLGRKAQLEMKRTCSLEAYATRIQDRLAILGKHHRRMKGCANHATIQ